MSLRNINTYIYFQVFSAKTRSSAAGLSSAVAYIFGFLANKLYISMVDRISIWGTYGFYSIVWCVPFGCWTGALSLPNYLLTYYSLSTLSLPIYLLIDGHWLYNTYLIWFQLDRVCGVLLHTTRDWGQEVKRHWEPFRWREEAYQWSLSL